jgi:hypothetical protein
MNVGMGGWPANAANLSKAGHDVAVYNWIHSKVEAAVCLPQFAAENNMETANEVQSGIVADSIR